MSVSNSVLLANIALDYLAALTKFQELQARTRRENREPTDQELDELAGGDDVKRARFQDAINRAREQRLAGQGGGTLAPSPP